MLRKDRKCKLRPTEKGNLEEITLPRIGVDKWGNWEGEGQAKRGNGKERRKVGKGLREEIKLGGKYTTAKKTIRSATHLTHLEMETKNLQMTHKYHFAYTPQLLQENLHRVIPKPTDNKLSYYWLNHYF